MPLQGSSSLAVQVSDTVKYRGVGHSVTSTSAVNLSGSSISTTAVGQVNDTAVFAILIPKAGTAATVILSGFAQDESGTAKTFTFTGSTSADTFIDLGGIINWVDKATVTVSAANGAIIWHSAPV